MKKVYATHDPAEAELVCVMLRARGISAVVQGASLRAAWGGLPPTDPASEVWVAAEEFDSARGLVEEYELQIEPSHCPNCGYNLTGLTEPRCPECGQRFRFQSRSWTCPKCGEVIEGGFTECWKCAGGEVH